MKKLLIALIALVGFSIAANAQTPSTVRQERKSEVRKHARHHRHRKFKRHHRRHHRTAQLNFSNEQKAQAKLYREEYQKQLTALDKNENITVKESRDKKMALRKEEHAKMQSLLTPEQKEKIAQYKTADKAKAQQHFAARIDKMKTKLNLSDKQVAQMKTQREEMVAKLKAIKEDATMDRTAKKEKLMALKTQMKEDNKKIFTADQLKQLEEMKKEKMGDRSAK